MPEVYQNYDSLRNNYVSLRNKEMTISVLIYHILFKVKLYCYAMMFCIIKANMEKFRYRISYRMIFQMKLTLAFNTFPEKNVVL